ncbi:MAG: hypothetical protein ACXWQR_13735 [Ktedonobacterales bacterium]
MGPGGDGEGIESQGDVVPVHTYERYVLVRSLEVDLNLNKKRVLNARWL